MLNPKLKESQIICNLKFKYKTIDIKDKINNQLCHNFKNEKLE